MTEKEANKESDDKENAGKGSMNTTKGIVNFFQRTIQHKLTHLYINND